MKTRPRSSRYASPELPPGDETVAGAGETDWIDRGSRLLDAQFRIPLTRIRFGMDVILGLIPGAGDFISLLLSGALVMGMVRRGAGIGLAVRMLANIAVDALVGTIPVVGDVFDLFFKANLRNARLMRQYSGSQIDRSGRPVSRRRRWVGPLLVWLVIAAIAAAMLVALATLFDRLFGGTVT